MNNTRTELWAEVLGRITTPPELKRTSQGVAVCRFTVATEAGPATNPVVKRVYVLGDRSVAPSEDLAIRCTHLRVGDLVYVPGVERQRVLGRGRRDSAIQADDVRLRARGGDAS
jgi:Single-strand binding protein family